MYEQRIQRAVDKNMAQLKTRQTERKEEAAKAMNQAKMLYRLAKAQGKPHKPKAYFIGAPEVKGSVFSSTKVALELSRAGLLRDAERYYYLDKLPKEHKPEQSLEVAAS